MDGEVHPADRDYHDNSRPISQSSTRFRDSVYLIPTPGVESQRSKRFVSINQSLSVDESSLTLWTLGTKTFEMVDHRRNFIFHGGACIYLGSCPSVVFQVSRYNFSILSDKNLWNVGIRFSRPGFKCVRVRIHAILDSKRLAALDIQTGRYWRRCNVLSVYSPSSLPFLWRQ